MNNHNELVRRLLSGITMSELQNFVNMGEEARRIPAPRRRREARPIPTPRKSVKQMVQNYEDNIIAAFFFSP